MVDRDLDDIDLTYDEDPDYNQALFDQKYDLHFCSPEEEEEEPNNIPQK